MKIVGNTVGLGLPKPDMTQTDPKKGNFVYGKERFAKGYIPVPATAEVGRYIVVSSVDNNGVVTATEAVDSPSGGGSIFSSRASGILPTATSTEGV